MSARAGRLSLLLTSIAALALVGVAGGCGSGWPSEPGSLPTQTPRLATHAPVRTQAPNPPTQVPHVTSAPKGSGSATGGNGNTGSNVPTGLEKSDWAGIWHGRVPDSFGISDVEMIFMADGTFSEQFVNASANYMLTITGQWDVFTFSGRPMLRFAVENWEPKEFCGPLGCSPVTIPTGMSEDFKFKDATHVIIIQPDCRGTGCENAFTKVG